MIQHCKIRGSNSGTAEDSSLLGCDALASRRFKVSYCIRLQEKAFLFQASALFLLIKGIMQRSLLKKKCPGQNLYILLFTLLEHGT